MSYIEGYGRYNETYMGGDGQIDPPEYDDRELPEVIKCHLCGVVMDDHRDAVVAPYQDGEPVCIDCDWDEQLDGTIKRATDRPMSLLGQAIFKMGAEMMRLQAGPK